MKVLSIVNQKGGVGKTTSAVNISAFLAKAGKKVLLIDCDPQGNATRGYGIDKEHVLFTIKDVLLDYEFEIEKAILKTDYDVDVIPSNIEFASAEMELMNSAKRDERLSLALRPLKDKYDYIILDCPPSLGVITLNALTASTDVFVPISASYYAFDGVKELMKTLTMVRKLLNDEVVLSGVFLTQTDMREKLTQETVRNARQLFGETFCETLIRRNTKLGESPGHGTPISVFAPNSYGAEDYASLVNEITVRCENV